MGKLKGLGSGFGILKLGGTITKDGKSRGGATMIMSVPLELDTDSTNVLSFAAASSLDAPSSQAGRVSAELLCEAPRDTTSSTGGAEVGASSTGGGLGWDKARGERALSKLASEGLCWVDSSAAGGVTGDSFVLSVWLAQTRQKGASIDEA